MEDALAAVRYGADAVGFVLHPESKRHVSLGQARALVAALPPFVTPVGLFVNASADQIKQTAVELGIGTVQLNGNESPRLIAELAPLRVIKSVVVDPARFTQTLADWRAAIAELNLRNLIGFVLEPANTGVAGGSGVANDWTHVARAQADGAFADLPPIIAAGGLTADNVADVINHLHPYAVDVSSGVEDSSPGIKSAEKIAEFIAAVREMDPGL